MVESIVLTCTLYSITCGNVMVNALHRDGGIGNRVALKVTHKALDASVNLQTNTHTQRGIIKTWFKKKLKLFLPRGSLHVAQKDNLKNLTAKSFSRY